ncbi:MAG: hypothetical protein Q8S84_04070 [bacterium]|nr:hypothetical protein [bacterium]
MSITHLIKMLDKNITISHNTTYITIFFHLVTLSSSHHDVKITNHQYIHNITAMK